MSPKIALLVALVLFGSAYVVALLVTVFKVRRRTGSTHPADVTTPPTFLQVAVGFVTNFFDSLGIGSFAPTTSIFKLRRMVPDQFIPGTLNVGHTIPTIAQALVFISIVDVDPGTLATMIGASVVGAWLGAGVVARWPRRKVQIGMGGALIAAAVLRALSNRGLVPGGGEALGLEGARLGVAVGANFVLGALMTLGVGLYAPCMIVVSLLGMNPRAAFPIMMGSCAFLMSVASVRFLKERSYSLRPSVGLSLGGVPGVLIGAFIVKSLELTMLRWLVVVVVSYTAIAMLRSAHLERRELVAGAASDPMDAGPQPA